MLKRVYYSPENVASLEDSVLRLLPEIKNFSPLVTLSNLDNICLSDGVDWVLLEYEDEGRYFPHLLFSTAGREAMDKAEAGLEYLKEHYPWVKEIKGATPIDKRAARWFNRKIGFTSLGIYDTIDGPCEVFTYKLRND